MAGVAHEDTGVEGFYVFDGTIGNPVGLINTAGTVVGAYAYDPYGAYSTTTSTGSAAGINPYRTAGGLYDRGTGWINTANAGTTRSPAGSPNKTRSKRHANPKEGNRYAYAADNPINYTDPTGMDIWQEGSLLAWGAVIGALGLVPGLGCTHVSPGDWLSRSGTCLQQLGLRRVVLHK